MTRICARCKGEDREFPFTIYGEKLHNVKENLIIFKGGNENYPDQIKTDEKFLEQIVCYHCWNMLKYGQGQFLGSKVLYRTKMRNGNLAYNKKGTGEYSTDEFAFDHTWIWLMNPNNKEI